MRIERALVIGAGGGVGEATADALRAGGATVLAAGRERDATDPAQVAALIEEADPDLTIRRFLATSPLAAGSPRHRLLPTRANGQLAFGHYSRRDQREAFVRHAITVLSLRGTEIAAITFFRSANAFASFALPELVEPSAG